MSNGDNLEHPNNEATVNTQIACHECDLLVNIPQLVNRQKASCPRCGFVLTRYYFRGRSKLMAFSMTSLLFLILTLVFPFLIFNAQGSEKSVFFLESIQSLGQETYFPVVLFMFITTLVVPTMMLLGINYVLLSSKFKRAFPFTKNVLRIIFHLRGWNMAEIFLLGILVSMVKIASLAEVSFGLSFFAFVLFVLSLSASRLYLDKIQAWNWVSQHRAYRKNN